MLRKRGQGMPMNVIVTAALVLLVLVVLAVIFIERARNADNTFSSCSIFGPGDCMPGNECEKGWQEVPNVENCGEDKICCIKLEDESTT